MGWESGIRVSVAGSGEQLLGWKGRNKQINKKFYIPQLELPRKTELSSKLLPLKLLHRPSEFVVI